MSIPKEDGTNEDHDDDDGIDSQKVCGDPSRRVTYTQLALRGTLATLAFRLLSFLCSQWTLRLLDPATLGRTSIRLELLSTTVLFLSREGFRLSLFAQSIVQDDDDQKWWTMAWCSLPWGTFLTLIALSFHLYSTSGDESSSSSSSNDDAAADYRFAGILYCWSCWIEICGEPMALYALRELQVTWKVSAESMATVSKTVTTLLFLHYLHSQWPVTAFGLAQLVYAMVYTSTLLFYTGKYISWPITTTTNFRNSFDQETSYRTIMFTLQACFKHFLTEGDRIVLTALSDNYNQGIYAMGSAYGGMAARILFQPVEENARLFWSRLLQQGGGDDDDDDTTLLDSYTLVIKLVLYVGFAFATLAIHYTEVLLNFMAGTKWGNNPEAVAVLSAFCVYTAFLAWNGTTEAFVYAACSSAPTNKSSNSWDIARLGLAHSVVGAIFAVLAPVAVRSYNTLGLVAVNCFAMFLRSLYSFYYAAHYFAASTNTSLQTMMARLIRRTFPHPLVMLAFILSFFITKSSMDSLRNNSFEQGIAIGTSRWFQLSLQHVGVGISCAVVVLSMAFMLEPEARQGIQWIRAAANKKL